MAGIWKEEWKRRLNVGTVLGICQGQMPANNGKVGRHGHDEARQVILIFCLAYTHGAFYSIYVLAAIRLHRVFHWCAWILLIHAWNGRWEREIGAFMAADCIDGTIMIIIVKHTHYRLKCCDFQGLASQWRRFIIGRVRYSRLCVGIATRRDGGCRISQAETRQVTGSANVALRRPPRWTQLFFSGLEASLHNTTSTTANLLAIAGAIHCYSKPFSFLTYV